MSPHVEKAHVKTYDARRGQAVVITDKGAHVSITWELLKKTVPLEPGTSVLIGFDAAGNPASVKLEGR